jgi:pyrroloquinoline quinone (PQQ) biosynthesis protein C
MMTREEFWQMADDQKLRDEYAANDDLRWLRTATMEELREMFLEYRVFTIYFADDLSLLVAKMPLGRLKSLMAQLVSEELGEGNPEASHIKLLEDFIVSLGVPPERLTQPTNPENLKLLTTMRELLLSKPHTYGVALRGMGGECICQIYLLTLYEQFKRNPFVEANAEQIDWRWWDIHAGPVDSEHNSMMKAAVDELMQEDPASVDELAAGYQEAKTLLSQFWNKIYRQVRTNTAQTSP